MCALYRMASIESFNCNSINSRNCNEIRISMFYRNKYFEEISHFKSVISTITWYYHQRSKIKLLHVLLSFLTSLYCVVTFSTLFYFVNVSHFYLHRHICSLYSRKFLGFVCGKYRHDTPHIYRTNLVRNFKTFSLGWNLVHRLIRMCRIQWWCSLFCFRS